MNVYNLSNEWVVSNRILAFRAEFWDCHGANIVTRYKGTYRERFLWRPKKRFLREIIAFSLQFYYTWIKICWYEGSVSFCWKYHEICHEKYRNISLVAWGLFRNRHCVMITQESLGNNSFKSFQLYLYMYSLFSCLLPYFMKKLRRLKIFLL